MFGVSIKRHRRGHPLTAKNLNSGHTVLEQVSKLRGGHGVQWSPGGVFLNQPGTIFRLGSTYSAGIPARASNGDLGTDNQVSDVYIAITNPTKATLKLATTTFRAFNASSQAVQPLTYIICALIFNLWVVIWEDCPAS